tara:strand:- start:259 stop:516 length:258 start_codon:yes stop_codon:yes gene_type:complete
MIKELRYIFYLLSIFFFIFFVLKFYLSENNIKKTNITILEYQSKLDKKVDNLPIIENDTNNIIDYKKEIEEFKNKKQRKYWILIK